MARNFEFILRDLIHENLIEMFFITKKEKQMLRIPTLNIEFWGDCPNATK